MMEQFFTPLLAGAARALAQSEGGPSMSLLELVRAGGWFGFLTILLSVVGLALAVMLALQVREPALAPGPAGEALRQSLSAGDAAAALEYCRDEENDCFLTRVMGAALARFHTSAFGLLELKSALEEAGQDEVARLQRSTDWLALIAAVAPMLGLLGTVIGMVGAFDTISASEGFAKPGQLAGDISFALITTVIGLVVAIPATAAATYFRNRIDAVTAEVALTVEDLASTLERSAMATRPPAGLTAEAMA